MMRLILVNIVTIGFLLVSATSASAINFFFGAPSNAGPMNAGDTFTITFRMDTEGETQITSVFASVFADPTLFSYVSGTANGQILFNASTYTGIPRILQPFVDPNDPLGSVRAAAFGAQSPSDVSNANQQLALLTFSVNEVFGDGSPVVGVINGLIAPGDDVTVNGISVAGDVTFSPSAPISVNTVLIPEPTTALLMGLGLAGLAAAGRRKD